jgi:2-polyprenyl-3-methyl-5-hydroxy-6-metoxy-1,4-benzoquinol methylase
MSFEDQVSKHQGDDAATQRAGQTADRALHDPQMEQVLRDFRSSVHAWSDAVYQRPRLIEVAHRRMAWRKAAVWTLGSVLVVGGAGGGLLEHQHRKEQARIAAAREAEQQIQIKEREAEEELARVDADVSREVPDAMEPLAQLMTPDETR